AIGRLQDTPAKGSVANGSSESEKEPSPDIGKYLHLGPLGTALLPVKYPRVLLIDEIDKSDIDLPNDLLNIFEEGEFEIPELVRIANADNKDDKNTDGKDDKNKLNNITVKTYDNQNSTIVKGKIKCRELLLVILT